MVRCYIGQSDVKNADSDLALWPSRNLQSYDLTQGSIATW